MKWSAAAALLPLPLAFAATAQAPTAQPPAAQKVIHDPAEYDAYMKAVALADPVAKAAALEQFVSTYPQSIMIQDALGNMVAAYQEAGNQVGVESAARRILVLKPDELRALAVMAFLARSAAASGDGEALSKLRDYAERGLRAGRPDGMSDADYGALRKKADAIFYGAQGFALISDKKYSEARASYLQALKIDPDNVSDNYQLGVAEVQTEPPDADGFWYLARAINLARAAKNEVAAIGITTFAQRSYKHFHGTVDGWDAIRVRAGVSGPIPTGFAASIARAPTPAEVAVQAMRDNDPATLSISDWEYVLSYRDASPANSEAAAKVWAFIQAKEKGGSIQMAFPLVVVSSTPGAIEGSVTDENIAAKIADLHVVLAEPLQTLPMAGSTVTATGVITDYQPHPFRFVMEKAHIQRKP